MNKFSRALALSSLIFFAAPAMQADQGPQQLTFSEEEKQEIRNVAIQACKDVIHMVEANDIVALEQAKQETANFAIPQIGIIQETFTLNTQVERIAAIKKSVYQLTKQKCVQLYYADALAFQDMASKEHAIQFYGDVVLLGLELAIIHIKTGNKTILA